MKWKLLLRKLSISSPEVSVRSRLPVSVRRLLVFLDLALAASAGVGIYECGRGFGGPDRRELSAQIERLELKLREAREKRGKAPGQHAGSLESRLVTPAGTRRYVDWNELSRRAGPVFLVFALVSSRPRETVDSPRRPGVASS